jgi:hypothetical protein
MRAGEYSATRLLEWGEFLLLNVNEISDSHRIMHSIGCIFFLLSPHFKILFTPFEIGFREQSWL